MDLLYNQEQNTKSGPILKIYNLHITVITQLYLYDIFNWNIKVNYCRNANDFWE